MINAITLNGNYGSTRLLTTEKPNILNNPEDKFETLLFLPEGENRKGEGGLRTKGYFKKSYDEKPLVSIITVVYNGEKYLEETIQSVINQTHDNVEYIIIDGGSTDGTVDIIKKYEDQIDYWVSEKDKGIYDAMNKGIQLVCGDWINFMNAGDRIFEENIIQTISSHLVADLVYGDHAVYKDDPNNYDIINVGSYRDIRNIPFCHQSLFVKTKLLKNNLFDLQYKIAADYDQYLRLKALKASILYVPMTVALFLDGGLSSISRKKLIKEYYTITSQYHPINSFFVFIIRTVKFTILGK